MSASQKRLKQKKMGKSCSSWSSCRQNNVKMKNDAKEALIYVRRYVSSPPRSLWFTLEKPFVQLPNFNWFISFVCRHAHCFNVRSFINHATDDVVASCLKAHKITDVTNLQFRIFSLLVIPFFNTSLNWYASASAFEFTFISLLFRALYIIQYICFSHRIIAIKNVKQKMNFFIKKINNSLWMR